MIEGQLERPYLDPSSPRRNRLAVSQITKETDKMSNTEKLLAKINEAVKAVNEAETNVTTATAELVSRSKTVGVLLLEAKRLHPKVADFEAFIGKVHSLKLSRAYDLLRLAGGRTTDEELRKEARERKQKSRANKKKLPRPAPALKKPEPESDSVTTPHVTESAEVGIEERKAQHPDLDLNAEERAKQAEYADWLNAREEAHKVSAHALAEFIIACRTWLPKVTNQSHRDKARRLVNKMTEPLRAEAA
jgi:hypothetical protein